MIPSLFGAAVYYDADAGFYRAAGDCEPISYPDEGHDSMFALEEQSFWFKHRNACLVELVRKFSPDGPICDIGGGNGFVSYGLQQAGYDSIVIEPGPNACRNAVSRGMGNVLCAGFGSLQVPDGSLSAIGLFDVLEHIKFDVLFLEKVAASLKQGGMLYLTVPAEQWLWSSADDDAGHFRRYSIGDLLGLLERCGLGTLCKTHLFSYLTPPLYLLRALPYRMGMRKTLKDEQEHASALSKYLFSIPNKIELSLLEKGINIPFGTSLVIVAQKNGV